MIKLKMWTDCRAREVGIASLAMLAITAPLSAQNLGIVTDWDDVASAFVFDADTDTILGEVVMETSPGANDGGAYDCEILDNQTLGFVAGWNTGVWVIDLTASPPELLAHPNNPIHPTSTEFNENLAITRDQRFLLVCDGSNIRPVSVIDIDPGSPSFLTEISSLATGEDHTSVAVCDDGTVLTTGFAVAHASRLLIDGLGTLTDTGENFTSMDWANYAAFSPPCDSAVIHRVLGGVPQLVSIEVIGLSLLDTRTLPGMAISGVMHPGLDLYYVRNVGFSGGTPGVQAWQYDRVTGLFVGGAPYASRVLGDVFSYYFGVEQLALHPSRTKLYTIEMDGVAKVRILDPITLADTSSVFLPLPSHFRSPSGICFRTTSVPLAVDLEDFKAVRTFAGEILVSWDTAAEIDNAGFQIYRQPWSLTASVMPDVNAVLVNQTMIPATGAPSQATSYRWLDESSVHGQAYHYWLVDIDVHGISTNHGPIAIR